MSCDRIDLKAYQWGEASPAEAAMVEQHTASCAACREELDRLELTQKLMQAVPDEAIPQRIAFVSDKIFEPSWWQKWLRPNPAWGLASALMLVSAVGLNMLYRPEPLVVKQTSGVSMQQITARMDAELARRVDAAVKQAVSESEARQAKLLKATLERAELDHKAELLQVREEIEVMGKRVNTMRVMTARADVGDVR
ncbi:MAG: zf-HC2 domain-containing protein [Bryobacterales bacterium]|nr:zf-HC2 domain-containing protein [Bryobacterales bacterium]